MEQFRKRQLYGPVIMSSKISSNFGPSNWNYLHAANVDILLVDLADVHCTSTTLSQTLLVDKLLSIHINLTKFYH